MEPIHSLKSSNQSCVGKHIPPKKTEGSIPHKSQAPKLSALQQKMKAKLEGAKFRMINEKLYTSSSQASFQEFQDNPSLFEVYHRGFREQVEKWPENPLDGIINWVKQTQKNKILVDFGCGEARLAQSVSNQTFSFDLVAANEFVTACDMANVPLESEKVDTAIFCLALMGSNMADFIREAHRVLKKGGMMKIAEVRSRFESEQGGLNSFVAFVEKFGFQCQKKDQKNQMFVLLDFVKCAKKKCALQGKDQQPIVYSAKPCVYKKR